MKKESIEGIPKRQRILNHFIGLPALVYPINDPTTK